MEGRIKWHDAFYAASELDFLDDLDCLSFQREVQLSKAPLRIDLNIIKVEDSSKPIKNEIGAIFRKYNIIEYKSPKDSMTINDFYKTIAYACLFKCTTSGINQIDVEEITITLFSTKKPVKLMKYLMKNGFNLEKKGNGIYYVFGESIFPTQIVVEKELTEHLPFKMLETKISIENAEAFVRQTSIYIQKNQKINADAVYAASAVANYGIFEIVRRRDPKMCEALRELFKDEIDESIAKAVAEKEETIAKKEETIAKKEETIAQKEKEISELLAENARLRAKLL